MFEEDDDEGMTDGNCTGNLDDDTLLEEDDDEGMIDGNCTGNLDESSVGASQSINIELADNINFSEVNNVYDYDQNSGVTQHSGVRITDTVRIDQDNLNNQHVFEDFVSEEIIISNYTDEISRISHMSSSAPSPPPNDNNEGPVTDKETTVSTTEERQQIGEPFTLDNYMSAYPSTSSSRNHAIVQQLLLNDSRAGKNVSARENIPTRVPQNSHKSNDTRSLSQQQHLSRSDSTAPQKKVTFRQDQVHLTQSTLPSNQTVPPTTSSTQKSAPSRAATATSALDSESSKEKRIEAIRQRMESCLNAITNKATDKAQRSPHAPFLAYLGTKLPNVPAEVLPNLEREILDLVKFHSK